MAGIVTTTVARHEVKFEPETHTYIVDGEIWPSVTTILKANGLGSSGSLQAMRRGTFVHAALHQVARKVFNPQTLLYYPTVAGYIRAGISFLEAEEFQPLLAEQIVLIPKLRVIGTLDLAGYFKRDRAVYATIDWKTGSVAPGTPLQLAGYVMGVELLEDYVAAKEPHERIVVELHDDGTFKPIVYPANEYPVDRVSFAAATNMYRWREKRGLLPKEDEYYESPV